MTVFDSLFNLAQTKGIEKQKPGQTDNDYLISIVRVISKVSDEEWNTLALPAASWFNQAAPLASAMQILPICPGFIGLDEVNKTATTSIPTKGLTAAEVFKSPASRFQSSQPNISNTPKEKKSSTGIMDAVRRTVIIHPEWTSRQVYDYLKLNGFPNANLDTISVDGGNIRRVIEIAKELGLWKVEKPIESEKETVQA
jgi:hypothetical protein